MRWWTPHFLSIGMNVWDEILAWVIGRLVIDSVADWRSGVLVPVQSELKRVGLAANALAASARGNHAQ